MDKLVKSKQSPTAIERSSQRNSLELTIARMLDKAAIITGRELMSGESRIWLELLKGQKPEAIEQAFKDHFSDVRGGVFFPKPADILAHIEGRRRTNEAEEDLLRTNEYIADMHRAWEEVVEIGAATLAKIQDVKAAEVPVSERRAFLEAQRKQVMGW